MGGRDPFFPIADPTRRAILKLLRAEGSMPAGAIAARFETLSRVAVSKHLRVLLEAGLVRSEHRGRQVLYSLRGDGLAALQLQWFEHVAPMFDADLQTLRRTVEGDEMSG